MHKRAFFFFYKAAHRDCHLAYIVPAHARFWSGRVCSQGVGTAVGATFHRPGCGAVLGRSAQAPWSRSSGRTPQNVGFGPVRQKAPLFGLTGAFQRLPRARPPFPPDQRDRTVPLGRKSHPTALVWHADVRNSPCEGRVSRCGVGRIRERFAGSDSHHSRRTASVLTANSNSIAQNFRILPHTSAYLHISPHILAELV